MHIATLEQKSVLLMETIMHCTKEMKKLLTVARKFKQIEGGGKIALSTPPITLLEDHCVVS